LEKNTAIKKVNQSVKSEIFTVTFFTYEAINVITRYDIALTPIGKPITTSLIIPARKI
jgi:hypothetical protein